MFSGKSEELLRRLRRAQIAGNKVTVVKPDIDSRFSRNEIVSHAGSRMIALVATSSTDLRQQTIGYDVVGVDEAQFFTDDDLVDNLITMSNRQIVIISALDQTFRREPFGCIPQLMAVADLVNKYSAVCHSCGQDATLTQRLINGKPAPFKGPTVQVGGIESYEARCRKCFRAA